MLFIFLLISIIILIKINKLFKIYPLIKLNYLKDHRYFQVKVGIELLKRVNRRSQANPTGKSYTSGQSQVRLLQYQSQS